MKKYATSKKKCQEMIKGICAGCGGKLKPIETVDNSGEPTFWSYCEICDRLDWGVEKVIWQIARQLVTKHHFIAYLTCEKASYQKNEKERKHWINTQTRGATKIVINVLNEYKKLDRNTKGDKMSNLFLKDGREAGLFDICKWWVKYYPKDIFCTSPSIIIQIRERMQTLLDNKPKSNKRRN